MTFVTGIELALSDLKAAYHRPILTTHHSFLQSQENVENYFDHSYKAHDPIYMLL